MEEMYKKMISDLALQITNLTLLNAELKAKYELELDSLNKQLDEATKPNNKKGE